MAIFQSFWHGKRLSPYQWLCLTSFRDHGHEFVLYSYDRIEVPDGIHLRDAAELLPRNRVFFYSRGPGAGSVSAFSNLFRYRLLHDKGGWWVDADVICLSRDVPADDIVFGWQDRSRTLVGSAILKFPREHRFVAELSKRAQEMGAQVKWGEAGPDLVTKLVREQGLDHLAKDASLIYPLEPADAMHVLMPWYRGVIREKIGGAVFLHLWNEILRRSSVLDAVAPPDHSFLAELCARHGVKFPSSLAYSDEQVQRLHDNFVGYLHSFAIESEAAAHRFEIAYLKGELDKARKETQSVLVDRDLHRQFMLKLSSSWLWRMSSPLFSAASFFRRAGGRRGQGP